jgi:hypothetical protein
MGQVWHVLIRGSVATRAATLEHVDRVNVY